MSSLYRRNPASFQKSLLSDRIQLSLAGQSTARTMAGQSSGREMLEAEWNLLRENLPLPERKNRLER